MALTLTAVAYNADSNYDDDDDGNDGEEKEDNDDDDDDGDQDDGDDGAGDHDDGDGDDEEAEEEEEEDDDDDGGLHFVGDRQVVAAGLRTPTRKPPRSGRCPAQACVMNCNLVVAAAVAKDRACDEVVVAVPSLFHVVPCGAVPLKVSQEVPWLLRADPPC